MVLCNKCQHVIALSESYHLGKVLSYLTQTQSPFYPSLSILVCDIMENRACHDDPTSPSRGVVQETTVVMETPKWKTLHKDKNISADS